jgi:HSP20 family protein
LRQAIADGRATAPPEKGSGRAWLDMPSRWSRVEKVAAKVAAFFSIHSFDAEKPMSKLARYDPFSLSRIDPLEDIDDLFKGFFVRPVAFEGRPQMQIKMDVKESDDAYTVHADIPGVKKDDIHVSIDGNQVSISAETKEEKEEKKGEKVLRSERYSGKVVRSFTLAHDVDEAKAQAKYSDGVLELSLPKKAVSSARKLAIQ